MKRKLKRLNKLKLSKAFSSLNRNPKHFTLTSVLYGGPPNKSIRGTSLAQLNRRWGANLTRKHFNTRGIMVTAELKDDN